MKWIAALWALTLPLAAQELWENPVKKLIREGKPVIGATVTVASADVAASLANMGFDFLWIEMEHSPITLETARNMVLATRGLKAVPFIRVPVNELWTAKRALDAGALGVVFPFTSTPELAKQAADSTKYPPNGRRGSGPGLPSLRWPAPEGYADFADRNAVTIIIIEEVRALDRIDEITATKGVDVIFIGTNDLSYSMGFRGKTDNPAYQAALKKIVASAKKSGKPVGRPAGTPEQIKQYMDEGFTFFQGPSDLVMMRTGAEALLKSLGKTGFDSKDKPLY